MKLSRSASVAFPYSPEATVDDSMPPPAPKAARTQSRNRQPVFGGQPDVHPSTTYPVRRSPTVSLARSLTVCLYCGTACNRRCDAHEMEAEIQFLKKKNRALLIENRKAHLEHPLGFLVDVNNNYDTPWCATFYVEVPSSAVAVERVRDVCFLDYGMFGKMEGEQVKFCGHGVSFQVICQATLQDTNIAFKSNPTRSGHKHAIVSIRSGHEPAQPCTKATWSAFKGSFPCSD